MKVPSLLKLLVVTPLWAAAFIIPRLKSPNRLVLFADLNADVETCDVAIFGGGFGGLYTALALSQEAKSQGDDLDIAIVDPSDRFIFLPLLYDLVVGTASEAEVCPTFEELLENTGIRHIRASFDNFTSSNLHSAAINGMDGISSPLSFQASVVSVGATPQATLGSIPGANELTQPFYTRENAKETRALLEKLELRIKAGREPHVAIVGGGYGGVELAACVKRRLPRCHVSLLARGAPMKGTRAEPLVDQALAKLGVTVELCSVESCKKYENGEKNQIVIERSTADSQTTYGLDQPWDAALWTAGSGPARPVCDNLLGLKQVDDSGRLAVDATMRCRWEAQDESTPPSVWALGDCSEIVESTAQFAVPRTAQAAIQQADVVATNVLRSLKRRSTFKTFEFQDLGSMLNLGGPNAAVLAPGAESSLGPLFSTLLDTTRVGLGIADDVLSQISGSPAGKQSGVGPVVESLGLSLGGYGLGVDTESAPGTLSGTLSGAARRAIYSLRMPTNKQRAKSAVLGALSTAAALSKEISDQIQSAEDSRTNN